MQINATLTREWKQRWLILTGFIFAGALWFYYDGFIGWPKAAERYAVYREMADSLVSSGDAVSERDRLVVDTWREYATQQGWDREIPKKRTDADFASQKKYGTGLIGVSVLLLIWYCISSRQTVKFDGKTIISANKTVVNSDDIFSLDKRKWKNKGIVYAKYKKDDTEKKLTLDAYKFDGVERIIEHLEKKLIGNNSSEDKEIT